VPIEREQEVARSLVQTARVPRFVVAVAVECDVVALVVVALVVVDTLVADRSSVALALVVQVIDKPVVVVVGTLALDTLALVAVALVVVVVVDTLVAAVVDTRALVVELPIAAHHYAALKYAHSHEYCFVPHKFSWFSGQRFRLHIQR